jgi:predicted metal-dependent HD superfamily phosphohydrolase
MQTEAARNFILHKLEKELPPHLTYHNVAHTKSVFIHAKELALAEDIDGEALDLLLTAALFHDTGFLEIYQGHEAVSCRIARDILGNFAYTPEQIDKICGIIMATHMPQQPQTLSERIICDADLYYLGTDDYWITAEALYQELQHRGGHKSRKEWMEEQSSFLRRHRYFTPAAVEKLSSKQQNNLESL